MGRKSLADKIFEGHREEEPGEDTWLVIYDFQGVKPSNKFYDNITGYRPRQKTGP